MKRLEQWIGFSEEETDRNHKKMVSLLSRLMASEPPTLIIAVDFEGDISCCNCDESGNSDAGRKQTQNEQQYH